MRVEEEEEGSIILVLLLLFLSSFISKFQVSKLIDIGVYLRYIKVINEYTENDEKKNQQDK